MLYIITLLTEWDVDFTTCKPSSIILQELTMLGFKSMYQSNTETFDIVLMVNNMYELLKLHQKSNRIRESLETE
jgi:hypothetical protein